MRIPVTDAFNDSTDLESREVKLTARQIQWLQEEADERGLSFDHMLRSVVTAQMRDEGDEPAGPMSGDGAPASHHPDEGASDPPSLVDRLRSASERLHDLTEDEEAEKGESRDTLARLQARLDNVADDDQESDEEAGSVLRQDRSMFDMMEE